jgi:hypothetical protein
MRIYFLSIFILLYLNRPDGLYDYQLFLPDSARQAKPFASNIGSIRDFRNVEQLHSVEHSNMLSINLGT